MSHYTQNNLTEMDVLMLFNLDTSQEGIKIHNTADPALISAANRLYDAGFITNVDGGYLTPLGREAADHTHSLFTMLNAHSKE